jgi:hypothetical protein
MIKKCNIFHFEVKEKNFLGNVYEENLKTIALVFVVAAVISAASCA